MAKQEKIKVKGIGSIVEGDIIQVLDKEKKQFSLKFDKIQGTKVYLKKMGRDTLNTDECEIKNLSMFLNSNYELLEKVIKLKH